ncbi:MAG: efflux RND transporter periplasmic adaptor subunit [Xanthomonadales bacterium]|nr:efflux RND transporter periplasmic adaptor subunit [Xanthomonadales bacterium]
MGIVIADSNTPVQVTAKPLQDVLIERQLSANAQVVALNDTPVSAEITAVVKSIHADIGDEVKQGTVLVFLDADDYELQLAQAKAQVEAAKARRQQAQLRLDRANELKQNQYISADDLLARETELAVQKAEYQRLVVAQKIAQRQLDKTQIKAPFTGVVAARSGQLGQLLSPGAVVVNLIQTDKREVRALIPNHLVETLKQAQNLLFTNSQITTQVEVLKVAPIINQQSSVQQARFSIIGELPVIGQTGQLTWQLEGSLLSADMVVKRKGQLGIFVVDGQQARFLPLNNAQEGRPVPIDTSKNWLVIVGGRERLQDGDDINVK